jgi:hypothetical protein
VTEGQQRDYDELGQSNTNLLARAAVPLTAQEAQLS